MAKPVSSTFSALPVRVANIQQSIYIIRGHKVMLDTHLAELYRVPTYRLNEAVKRNRKRFPDDFMFRLTGAESRFLTSHFAMSKIGRGGRRSAPYAFTEHGVAMLSSVLKSERAVRMNILVIRAFVKLRELLATHRELALRIERLEGTQDRHGSVLDALIVEIGDLKRLPPLQKRLIGFKATPTTASQPPAPRPPSSRAR
jgi:ORF6N domain